MPAVGGGGADHEPEVGRRRASPTNDGYAHTLGGDTAIMYYVVRAAMQALDPRDTAAVILASAFPGDAGFVAGCLGCSEGDLPGLLVEARTRLRRDRVGTITEPVEALRRLRATWIDGDRAAVADLLSPDVALFAVGRTDTVCRLPVHGSRQVARLLCDIMGDEPPTPELTLVDRVPWLVEHCEDLTVAFLATEVHHGSVRRVWLVDARDRSSAGGHGRLSQP